MVFSSTLEYANPIAIQVHLHGVCVRQPLSEVSVLGGVGLLLHGSGLLVRATLVKEEKWFRASSPRHGDRIDRYENHD